MHIALLIASVVLAFGVSNYLTGLPLKDAANIIQMPVNMKLVLMYSVIIYGIGLIGKQGFCLFLQNKLESNTSSVIAEEFMMIFSLILFSAVYLRTGNLWVPIIMHTIADFVAFCHASMMEGMGVLSGSLVLDLPTVYMLISVVSVQIFSLNKKKCQRMIM